MSRRWAPAPMPSVTADDDPAGRFADLLAEHAPVFESFEVGQALAHRGAAHETLDAVPGPGPVHLAGDTVGGVEAVADGGQHLLEAGLVVLDELIETALQADEAMLVGGKDLLGVPVGAELVEGLEEGPQRILAGLGVVADVRGDAGQHVVARQHDLMTGLPEAEVPR